MRKTLERICGKIVWSTFFAPGRTVEIVHLDLSLWGVWEKVGLRGFD